MWGTRPITTCYFVFPGLVYGVAGCLALFPLLSSMAGCQRPKERVSVTAEAKPAPPVAAAPSPSPLSPEPPRPVPREEPAPIIEPPPESPDRWLTVEKSLAGFGTVKSSGVFDAKRNKISINVDGVEEFSIDIDRMPIDWDRLVVLSINGENSELRWRDYSPILFRRDKYGRWSVVEP